MSTAGMAEKGSCCAKTEMHAGGVSKCGDLSGMTKEECIKMCKEKGCTAEETAKCLAHYDANGKYAYQKTDCFDTSKYDKTSEFVLNLVNENGISCWNCNKN